MAKFYKLSKRESEVLQQLLQGKSNKQIALSLNISARTVEFHLKNIYIKFQVSSRVELILNLGKYTGTPIIEKPGTSTVDLVEEKAENSGMPNSQIDWAASSYIKRTNTMKTNIKTALQNALTGFAPGVLVLMSTAIVIDWIRYFIRNRNWADYMAALRNPSFWEIVGMELFLLTSGYILMVSLFDPKYLSFARWRSVFAGVGAAILLAVLSIFSQGASLPMIVLASLSAGMLSVLFVWHPAPQITTN